VLQIQAVDSAIHKAETVGRAHNGVGFDFEYRAPVNTYEWQVATPSLPCICERRFDGNECDL